MDSGQTLELSDEELNKDISADAPKDFEPIALDYKHPPEELMAGYRLAILQTKSQCGWTKMDYRIRNENRVSIERLDTGHYSNIIRSPDNTWSVEGYQGGLNFYQAIILANFINKVHGVLQKEKLVGANEKPFELDGNNIDFDENWAMTDTRILAEGSWMAFYDKMGVSKEMVADTLNEWYQKEYLGILEAA